MVKYIFLKEKILFSITFDKNQITILKTICQNLWRSNGGAVIG